MDFIDLSHIYFEVNLRRKYTSYRGSRNCNDFLCMLTDLSAVFTQASTSKRA